MCYEAILDLTTCLQRMVKRLAHTLNVMRNSALFLPAWDGKKMRSTTDDDTIILEAQNPVQRHDCRDRTQRGEERLYH